MAALIVHYLASEIYNNKYLNYDDANLISFLVGAIAADAPRTQGRGDIGRGNSHINKYRYSR